MQARLVCDASSDSFCSKSFSIVRNFVLLIGAFVASDVYGATCQRAGYSAANVGDGTFSAPDGSVCRVNGYTLVTVPDEMEFVFTGTVTGNEITICDNGYYSGGACVGYTSDKCTNNQYSVNMNTSTFSAPDGSICRVNGYTLATVPDEIGFVFTGALIGAEIPLCTNGYYSNGACVSYSANACITGYYDLNLDSNTFAETTDGACSTPYTAYNGTTHCDHNPGETCVDLPTPIINITYQNGDETFSTSSCYYDDVFTLPTTVPTRVGYTFAGWSVVSQ